MAISFKDSTANFALDQLYDTKFPAASLVRIRSGAPAGPNNAAGGTLLASPVLPAGPWAAAAAKSKAKAGVWSANAVATGTGGHFRMENAGDTEREEGTITAAAGGGDMTLDNTSIAINQPVTVQTFTRTLP
jgi:hypothetical protein